MREDGTLLLLEVVQQDLRDHSLFGSSSGLITIAGGKWTIYRKMAEDVVDRASKVAILEKKGCVTKDLKIHGWDPEVDGNDPLDLYGMTGIILKKL